MEKIFTPSASELGAVGEKKVRITRESSCKCPNPVPESFVFLNLRAPLILLPPS